MNVLRKVHLIPCVMKTKLSLQAAECTFDEVIFSNRNQAYGAYDLRKKYNKHLMLALLFVALLFISVATFPIIYNYLFPPETEPVKPPDIKRTTVITVGPDFKIPEIKPPDLNKAMAGVINKSNTGLYKPVDTIQSTTDQTLALADQQSIDTSGIEGPIVFVPQSANSIIPDDETIYTYVEEPATFQGGNSESFRDWVISNYVYPPSALESRIEGKVNFNFVVDKNGEITDIKIARSEHQVLSEETIKVLSDSPKWQPAKQNGRFVKQRFNMQIQLVIQ